MMKLRGGIDQVKRYVRRIIAPFRSQAAILMYHRVFDASSDPWDLCVSPQNFAEHLEHLRRHYSIVSLRNLMGALKNGNLQKGAVVLTFDDGYADNLWNAKPLLERYEVPATVFVSTGYVDSDREFWWDELERLLLLTPELPQRVHVTLNGSVFEWELGEWARLPLPGQGEHPNGGDPFSDEPTPRHRAYQDLHRMLCPLGHEEREAVLGFLGSQAGTNGKVRPGYRALTSDEVSRLAEGGLVEIGSHTVTHPVLSAQPREVQRWEMVNSKRHLEAMVGDPVTTFCYPYGDTCETTTQLAQEAGFEAACSTFQRLVRRQADPFQLPRFFVDDWDGDEFARRLYKHFSG